jgi:hypothetical protein
MNMKVGDLIKNKTQSYGCIGVYAGKFLVVGIKDAPVARGWIGTAPKQVRAKRISDGSEIRWLNIESWEVISESG